MANQYTRPGSTEVNVTHINNAESDLVANVGICQIGIANDTNCLIIKDKDGNAYAIRPDKISATYADATGVGASGNILTLKTDSVTAMTIDADQNVGIGIATPVVKLDVRGELHTGSTGGLLYSSASELNAAYNTNADGTVLYLNNHGYLGGTTKYRNLTIGDGKEGAVALFAGATKLTTLYASLALPNCGNVGGIEITGNGLNCGQDSDTDGVSLVINELGYNNSGTRFRNLVISNGKESGIAEFTGSTKLLTLYGNQTFYNTATAEAELVAGKIDFVGLTFDNPPTSPAVAWKYATITGYAWNGDVDCGGGKLDLMVSSYSGENRLGITILCSSDDDSFAVGIGTKNPSSLLHINSNIDESQPFVGVKRQNGKYTGSNAAKEQTNVAFELANTITISSGDGYVDILDCTAIGQDAAFRGEIIVCNTPCGYAASAQFYSNDGTSIVVDDGNAGAFITADAYSSSTGKMHVTFDGEILRCRLSNDTNIPYPYVFSYKITVQPIPEPA